MRWIGLAPLLMRSNKTVDPLDELAKEMKKLTSKKTKTDDDYAQLYRLDFMAGLYWQKDIGPFVPARVVEATVRSGAKKNRLGTAVQSSVFCLDDMLPLGYDGPRDRDKLYADPRFVHRCPVNMQGKSVIRTRPHFADWWLDVRLQYDPETIDADQLRTAVEKAGALCGLCDWRPRFGRFTVDFTDAA